MNFSSLISLYHNHRKRNELVNLLRKPGRNTIYLNGLTGSSKSLLLASSTQETGGKHLVILQDKEEASYFHNDLLSLGFDSKLHFFPSSYKRSIQFHQRSSSNIVLRTRVLKNVIPESLQSFLVITYPEALVEKVISREFLANQTLRLAKGDHLTTSQLAENLTNIGFIQTDFVYEPGHFSVRGGIIDIFSYSDKVPVRIDFWGNEINSIRSFEIETQRSIERFGEATLIPDTQSLAGGDPMSMNHNTSLISYLSPDVTLWSNNSSYILEKIDDIYKKTTLDIGSEHNEIAISEKNQIMVQSKEIINDAKSLSWIEFGLQSHRKVDHSLVFSITPQPPFHKNFELLSSNLEENADKGYQNYILSDNPNQLKRLQAIFKETEEYIPFEPVDSVLHEGFTDHDLCISVYTDHQIFERYHKYRMDEPFSKKENITIRELSGLHPGDYVVHIDHGIGQFGGLEKIDISGREQEAVKLVYKDNDILYVSIHSLHRISKYKGKNGQPPKIYKLGTGTWQRLKQKTKRKVKDIARELIEMYAKRKAKEGFQFSPDSYLQQELEASFLYEDTEDQLQATRDVKSGMEALFPMDRLVCGDVGFGKTEVAIRAAFKAVADSKQVALLVPTTVLVLQHYHTFLDRLKDFPCSVDHLSRLKKFKDQKATIEKVADGKIDILIGTHRLVSEDIKFKDLGLLIIDEEQKFGVRVKEKLRKLKLDVDTLSLTATPIPRTLELSLIGARDLSIINTPPPNRYPIVTELHLFNEEIIKEAIYYEVSRNGQVFFIHNRIQNINDMEKTVNRLCPDIETAVVHGQMEGARLENIMLDFIQGRYDVLIATTIIESGLDIPNANTMIINNAHHFGLSDLHQLRGRVGRSNKRAFCYLLAPPLTLMTPEARRRLQAIEEFSELGSGFNIALQDLDIRGAGNLLGAEQSGFIAEIGFETYHRILDEALLELKENEYNELFNNERSSENGQAKPKYVTECHIDTDLEILFPDMYIHNISERLRLYRVLDSIDSEEKLIEFRKELEDRFGKIPSPTEELLNVVRLRWQALKLGFEKIVLKKQKMIIFFISDQDSAYYQSPLFDQVLHQIQKNTKKLKLKESKGKLTLITDGINSISEAIQVLKQLTLSEISPD